MIVTFVCPSAPHPVGGVTALYEFGNGLARRGHRVHLVHCPFFRNRISSMDDLSWFKFEPTVEHHLVESDETDLPHADIFFGSTGRPENGLPVVLIQGYRMLHLGLERDAFQAPCLKVCIASWLAEVGQQHGVPPGQIQVVLMGIDHTRYRLITPVVERPPRVGMLYSSHPAKGWETGRRTLEMARAESPALEGVVFGTTDPPHDLPSWVKYVRNPDQDELVEEIYNKCQVFVQPSDYEGFGFTAVEAMACGAALVTTDNGGSRDYAFAGQTAMVAAVGDPGALAEHVLTLTGDLTLRASMAEAGRLLVIRKFNWDRASADLEAALERYLSDPQKYQTALSEDAPSWDGDGPFALPAP